MKDKWQNYDASPLDVVTSEFKTKISTTHETAKAE
jgi:hypothetical protein